MNEPAPLAASGVRRRRGFTLIELLLVVAIVAVLAGLLLPALTAAKTKAKTSACLNQLKQFGMAAQIYSGDNAGLLVPNSPTSNTNGWVGGSMKVEAEAADPNPIRQARLFPYVGQFAPFHCPADNSTTLNSALRLRSYSMNSWIGSRTMESASTGGPTNGRNAYRTFVKDAELATSSAATLWLLADEHEVTIDDGYFLVTMNDLSPFASFPATRHQRSFTLSFVDGHVETWKLRDPNTVASAQKVGQITANNSDWLRLKQATTVPQ